MLQVDTAALDAVLRSLQRGTPATALGITEFQDELLQQTLEVGPLVRYAAAGRYELGDGWLLLSETLTSAGMTQFQALSWDIMADADATAGADVLWVYDLNLFAADVVDSNDIGSIVASYQQPARVQLGTAGISDQVLGFFRGTNIAFLSAQAGFIQRDQTSFPKVSPVALLPGGGNLLLSCNLDATALAMEFTPVVLARRMPAGVPPYPA